MQLFSLRHAALFLISSAVAGCVSGEHVATDTSGLPPLSDSQIRQRIIAWSADFFAEPASVRAARISVPVAFRTRTGTKTWLVCIEYDTREPGGSYVGVQRLAFGVVAEPPPPQPVVPGVKSTPWTLEGVRRTAQTAFYPPQGRHRNEISNAVCDRMALIWKPFPELERLRSRLSQRVLARAH